MSEILYVMIGGFFGAIARFSLSTLINSKTNSLFPYGTVIVNLLGCFLMGVVVHFLHWENVSALLVVGFLGAFTTFSSVQLEMVELIVKKQKMAFIYFFVTYIGGIALFMLGLIMLP
ncbi:CrcB family protein [Cytobacillus sp. FSL W7-1323]|uniref:fluoride efflux transporter FluC n=1 Tax=Cytobacillus TaxID=2675230 RepID=UPI00278714ED|nr:MULTISPECIES: CrcB family protein [Cytobacillus]MDQ0184362.1 CrcB protein [Cytobacillus kochii]MEA1852465.1 CrcB family protein [Cytobacillus sp. OWB-43]MED1604661.1 CrcB family protein [Cytobacillus kochii]